MNADPRNIAIADLTYELPEDRIAQHPLAQRDEAKLLIYRNGTITDRQFSDLPGELPENTLLVLNDTRVVHARVPFRRSTGALIECMVLSPESDRPMEQALLDRSPVRWRCMVGNAKRWKGEELLAEKEGHALKAERKDLENGEHLIEFSWENGGTFLDQLDVFGEVPLPPYMRRAADDNDDTCYNTVFAERPGSVAAPTASLHFTPAVMGAVAAKGIALTRVTLHVGAGTFLPVKSDTMAQHAMHSEQLRIPRSTVTQLLAQLGNGPVVPVGTTALRTIESLYWHGADLALGADLAHLEVNQWRPYAEKPEVDVKTALEAVLKWMEKNALDAVAGNTSLLIAPGYEFRIADGLVTNFHQPKSTLLLLVAAMIGPQWRAVYAHALANGYRFLSYGDGSLLWKG
ncbi:MAG: S-adenosylmethionine:tRNA ribosyltransferase-isomerase [Flavobacteriales bacterium]|jgi:S-adenosylmethionine:tRNA ribosyltransferase-isomerase|nr:S-adenosylmethionine:tRNA ribosyltransferase-isomerase [Flavobacteriales bacterium]MCI1754242.1 S-adenosylmethionine:tRNA ribosyltransferase-isomerase [Flavobacteriales bacterium]